MNQRRPRPSAPVSKRDEDSERLSEWVSPWSLDPDLPPQRRPRPLGWNDSSTAAVPAMPPPSLSVPPSNFEVASDDSSDLPEKMGASVSAAKAEPIAPVVVPTPETPASIEETPLEDEAKNPPSDVPDSRNKVRDKEAESESMPVLAVPKKNVSDQPKIEAKKLPSFPTQPELDSLDSQTETNPRPKSQVRIVDSDDASEDPQKAPNKTESSKEAQTELALLPKVDRTTHWRREGDHPGVSWGTLICLSSGLLAFTFLTWLFLHDIKPEDDSDLRIDSPVDVTPTISAPQRLQVFLNSIQPLESRRLAGLPPSHWDTPALSRFVQSNGPALDNLKDLLENPDWHPRHSSWHDVDLGAHRSWSHAAILKQAEAAYHARLQQEETAFVALIDLAELGRRVEELWAWPSFMQRSLDIQNKAAQSLATVLQETRLSAAMLGQFQRQYDDCKPDVPNLNRACNAFFTHEKKLLLGASSGEPLDTMPGGMLNQRPSRLLFKTYETLSLFANAMRLLKIETAESPFTSQGRLADFVRRIRKESMIFYQPNAAGHSYFCERMEHYLPLPLEHALTRTRHELVCTLFATRRHLSATKALPTSIEDLVPTYLPSVSKDPFSGEPLRLNPVRGLIHSVGSNLADEGGMITDPPMNDPGEPTVRIGIALATAVR